MLQNIADPTVRGQALRNAGVLGTLGGDSASVADAIRDGFIWEGTEEGFEYWRERWDEEKSKDVRSRGLIVSIKSATIKEEI